MLVILAFIILFHLATSILLFVATIHNVSPHHVYLQHTVAQHVHWRHRLLLFLFCSTCSSLTKAWWVVSGRDEVIYTDLWYSCNQTCYPVENSHTVAAGKPVKAAFLMQVWVVFAFKPLFFFLYQLTCRQFRPLSSWPPFYAASASSSSSCSSSASNRERDSFSQLLSSCWPVRKTHIYLAITYFFQKYSQVWLLLKVLIYITRQELWYNSLGYFWATKYTISRPRNLNDGKEHNFFVWLLN